MKTSFEKKFLKHAIFFTKSFEEELSRQAQDTVKDIIHQIYLKAFDKWRKKQTEVIIER